MFRSLHLSTLLMVCFWYFVFFSAFVTKLLLGEEIPGDMTEAASTKPEDEDFTVHGGEKDGGIYHHPYLNKTGELMMSALSTTRYVYTSLKIFWLQEMECVLGHFHPNKLIS